jgi:hypothetical protein
VGWVVRAVCRGTLSGKGLSPTARPAAARSSHSQTHQPTQTTTSRPNQHPFYPLLIIRFLRRCRLHSLPAQVPQRPILPQRPIVLDNVGPSPSEVDQSAAVRKGLSALPDDWTTMALPESPGDFVPRRFCSEF